MRIEDLGDGVRVARDARTLAMDPDIWAVDLRDGRRIRVLTDGYSIEGDEIVFSLLFDGKPGVIIETLRIPADLLARHYLH